MIKKTKKWEDLLSLTAVFLSILLINIHVKDYPLRLDLTEEKRYTISAATKDLLTNLDDVVYIEVYLDGELNAGLKRLQKSIRETLDEFRLYAGNKLEFKFVDPSEAPNPAARNRFYQQLNAKGLPPTTLYDEKDGQQVQKVIFPGAIMSYKNKEQATLLLKGNRTASAEQQLNQSVEGVEFELANTIKKLSIKEKRNIAFIEGHEELTNRDLLEITDALSENYYVDRIKLEEANNLERYSALIVAQPKKPFSEAEKYRLDQYIMNGGKAMFMLDKVQMNLDSIAIGGTYAFGYDLNIEDLLFRYGVRVNVDLIQDLSAGSIEVYTGEYGDRPNVNRLRWPYYVFLRTFSDHPIVRNMDVVYSKFISTIDTVKAENVKKTALMMSSQYSRVKKLPAMVDLNELKEGLSQERFNSSFLPVAYLLEGNFKSLYANRFPPTGINDPDKLKESPHTKIIVVSDGDLIRNEFDQENRPEPLDFDRVSRQPLSNKEFMLNSLAYLIDEDGLISTRAKQVTMRPLDTFKVNREKTFWQVVNIVVPIAMVILFGLLRFYLRKRKYTTQKVVPKKVVPIQEEPTEV